MRYLWRVFFYLSLTIEWCAYIARYWLLRVFGSQKDIAGVRVILVHDDTVVLVRHWFTPGVWTLPGGGIRKGETANEAGIREIFEEIGYKINSFGGQVGIYRGRMGRKDSVIILYTEDFEGRMQFVPNLEIMERGLFDINHLPENLSPANRRRINSFLLGVRNERGVW
ncbi:MAG: MutT/nudix family hydrolase [Parcubacteria group bacterium Gr01-1014_56]|nr:MAG: MutT/nudix family hydrolase [Parcubacteria group bacterium Gr01-1014_56]